MVSAKLASLCNRLLNLVLVWKCSDLGLGFRVRLGFRV